jgi:rhodanese-related sulfurtransferase
MAQMLRAHTNSSKKKLSGNWMKKEIVNFDNSEENLHYEGVIDIDPKELLSKKDQVILIDVRQPDEFSGELGHIPGSELMVLDTLPERIQELPKDKTVVFVCRSGSRSARATAFAKSVGYKFVFNLKGGMLLWNELHLPTEM